MSRTADSAKLVLTFCFTLLLFWNSPAVATPFKGQGQFLVADEATGIVHHYSATGVDLGVFSAGLDSPAWITTDRAGNVYVSEFTGGRVDKFSPAGTLLLTIPTGFIPGGVRVADNGTIYVGDYFGGSVFRWSASGVSLGLFASTGLGRADFLAFDGSGNLYVSDFSSGSIRRISPTGTDLGNFITGFIGAEGIAFDATGNVYVSNDNLNLIERYSASGLDLGTFAVLGPPDGINHGGYGLAFDRAGHLFAASFGTGTVREFSPSGMDLGIFVSGLVNPRDLVIGRVPQTSTLILLTLGLALLGYVGVWRKSECK